ncbi:hypothetical protein PAPYR_5076 [Paratrimastix pyriformis]|uniref:Uncharacterized protein n=1 Tax=Paratrimastix pyriformis TaxID=342808 RepID=A0ABQ8UIG9_9EUKA|nr:hypothetical protein PAPYR_5076 [Paratrimastix pyriformis]
MAHIFRAKRILAVPSEATPTNIGPGTYTSSILERRHGEGYAPFSSRAERKITTAPEADIITPGPGSYLKDSHRPPKDQDHFSAFASKTTRFEKPRRRRGPPGPGAYDVGLPWEKDTHRVEPASKNPGGALAFPSVSRTNVPWWGDCPAPGAYNPEIAASPPAREGPSSVFVSAVQRDFQRKTEKSTPGPGYYKPRTPTFRRELPPNERVQHFGTTSKRLSALAGGSNPLHPAMPGPGAYEDPRIGLAKASFARMGLHAFDSAAPRFTNGSVAPAPGPGAYEPLMPATTIAAPKHRTMGGFGSTIERFPDVSAPPPPGAQPLRTIDQSKIVQDRPRSVRPLLDPSPTLPTSLTIDQSKIAMLPGPGAYADSHEAPVTMFRRLQPNSAFVSAQPRFVRPKQADLPAPGQYELQRDWARPRPDEGGGVPLPSAAFRSGAPRIVATTHSVAPGPGAYEVTSPPLEPPSFPRKEVFIAQSPRFLGSRIVSEVPGPGSYASSPPDALLKRTYNVTIANPHEGL